MKKILLTLLIMICISSVTFAQTNIALDDFETTASSPNFNFSFSGGGYQTGSTASGDRPASTPYYQAGTRARQVSNATATLTSAAINTTGNNFITFRIRVMAMSLSSTSNGMDASDFVRVEISPNNGANYYNTVEITGNSNCYWSYSGGTGIANANYDGNATPVSYAPAGGGSRTSDGYGTIRIDGIPAVSQLRVRITMDCSSNSERWVIDNAQLLGTSLAPLPVKFGNIKAFEKMTGIQIDWTSYSEVDVDRYVIERSSNGSGFTSIGEVTALNSSNETPYGFFDAGPLPGISYYRLRNLDMDGKSGYSNIVRVDLRKDNKDITLYPNPVRSGGYISYGSANMAKGNYSASIFNAAGQQVFIQKFSHNGGAINQTIQLPASVRSGYYTLQLEHEGTKLAAKTFMVQ